MSEEIVRRAAALMRERATRAEARRWYPSDLHDGMDEIPWFDITAALPGDDDDPINEFVDSWHPAVALAVADMLDGAAELARVHGRMEHGDNCPVCGPVGRALAVARAYLGCDA